MKFNIQQVAIFPPNPDKAIRLLKDLGLSDWAKDMVTAWGWVHGRKESKSIGSLAFNYQGLGEAREFEVLAYKEGQHWMQGKQAAASHLGTHCTQAELADWRRFFKARGIAVAQELYTLRHTNSAIKGKRWYHYVIFNTRPILGIDLKFIVREERPIHDNASDEALVECLRCGHRSWANREHDLSQLQCSRCGEFTNHCEPIPPRV